MAAGAHFDGISGHFRSIQNYFVKTFLQNGRRRPFWMSEIHFWTHFWPFQIDMQLKFIFLFLTKWLPSITFLAISDRYATLFFLEFFYKMAAVGHCGCPKFLSITFLAILNQYKFFWKFLQNGRRRTFWMFWTFLIAFLAISDRSAILDVWNSLSIAFFLVFSAAILDVRLHFWPFLIDQPNWMSEIHFRWHFWPFQIHTDLNYLF